MFHVAVSRLRRFKRGATKAAPHGCSSSCFWLWLRRLFSEFECYLLRRTLFFGAPIK